MREELGIGECISNPKCSNKEGRDQKSPNTDRYSVWMEMVRLHELYELCVVHEMQECTPFPTTGRKFLNREEEILTFFR
jgi:hypothetical protein